MSAGRMMSGTGADSDDRAQPFRHDGAQRSEMIAISGGHPVDINWVSVSKVAVNR
jgi:hypothetical protein